MAGNGMRLPGVLGLLVLFFPACMDDGFDGSFPPRDVFVNQGGCFEIDGDVKEEVKIGFDVDRLEATLRVFRGAADLVLGTGEAPSNYFSPGRGPGTQKLRVGPGSHVPVMPGTWFVRVVGAPGVSGECDPDRDPDWHLVLRRTPSSGGTVLLSETCDSPDCAVPVCNGHPCPFREIGLDVPADAGSLEVVLNSVLGDADLLLVSEAGVQLGASTNPGAGYDIVVLGPDAVVPLRGRTLLVRLTSWARTTEQYDLQAAYRPGP